MEEKKEDLLVRGCTAKYQDPYLDSVFMAAMSDVYMALQKAGFEPFHQLAFLAVRMVPLQLLWGMQFQGHCT